MTEALREGRSVGLYGRYVLPFLIDAAMGSRALNRDRGRWIPRAQGSVLEIGAGTGRNASFYGASVEKLFALEPSEEVARRGRERWSSVPFPVEVLSCSAESIPLGDGTVDTAVSTWTLCSIGDPIRALREVSRVLRPGGHLIFIEHGRSPDVGTAAWQRRLTPLWRRVAGGCHLDRPIPELIASAGFHREEFEDGYARGPRVTSFFYRGVARVDA